jgi:NLR family CARD domain-containing protein 3
LCTLLFQGCRPNSRAIPKASDQSQTSIAETSDLVQSIPTMAFGAEEWAKYFGEVGAAPPLPSNIDGILNSPCPFWSGKQVKDTHLLVLVPAMVDGNPLTLGLLGQLIQSPKGGGSRTTYCNDYSHGHVQAGFGNQPSGKSYWVLMTRDLLPKSLNQTYEDQKTLVADYATKANLPYELSHALEAAVAILMHHARTGECLYNDNPETYTRCQETVCLKGQPPVILGKFSSEGGLRISFSNRSGSNDCGVSCLRKF